MKKNLKINHIIIIFVILFVIFLILSLTQKNDNKVLIGQDYIIEKQVDEDNGKLKGNIPIVNLIGDDINDINEEIINKYYSILYNENDIFEYEANTYQNILSVLITVTYVDNSEYGSIEYYSYNIDINTGKLLTNKELLSYLNIDSNTIKENINIKLKDYYNKDSLKKDTSYDEYLEIINYDAEKNVFFIKSNQLRCYNVIDLTPSLIEYTGNIYRMTTININ